MLTKILNLGVDQQVDLYQKRETWALNIFATVTLVGILVGVSNIFLLGRSFPLLSTSLESFASLLIFYLNWRRHYRWAANVYVVSMSFMLFYVNSHFSYDTGGYLYYFPFIFCVALLHNPNKKRSRDVIFFAIIAAGFICSRLPVSSFITKANLSADQTYRLFLFNLFLCISLTILLVFMIIRVFNRQYAELSELLNYSRKDQQIIQNSLREKEVLLAEIQHRVKNNLSVIIGLFNLQKANAVNEETRQAINEARNRVLSIAMVHERLYKKEDLSRINLRYYISELAREVVRGHPLHSKVKITEELQEMEADITRAVPIGLVVNESITNALKHAFSNGHADPQIKLILNSHFGVVNVKIIDNGPGFPKEDSRSEKSLGLTLIESLAQQIDGTVHYTSNGGASVKLSFPE